MLRCEAVSKRYGRGREGRQVLDRVDLSVAPGDVLAVAGANGSGKSTLLRIVAGFARPTSGSVTGRPTAVGYVPDRFTAPARLSAISYLTHMGRLRGLSTGAARARGGELLDRLSLAGGPDAPLRVLSKGNAQKVSIAQALITEPELLILDEPWSGLDASAHDVLGDLLAQVAARGGTVVFTDHREAMSGAHADQVCVIDANGRATHRRPSQRSLVEVVLTPPPDGGAPNALNWAELPGISVHGGRDGSGRTVLRVARQHSDALLLAALRGGWSVEAVRR